MIFDKLPSGALIIGDPDNISPSPLVPYSAEVRAFAADLSAALMSNANARLYPDVLSFAYWCRRANITRLTEEYRSREGKGARIDSGHGRDSVLRTRIGRGLVFHVTPSNVPVNFAFSCMFGLLSGNANIVRVPSRLYAQIEIICDVMRDVQKNHPMVKERTLIVRYPADDEITAAFSAAANARVIWGGDETCAKIRTLPCRPRCVDVVFPDRYSIAILDGGAVERSSEKELAALAHAFYNDTYLTDQNACSSPRIVFFKGGAKEYQKERFWQAVAAYADNRYSLQAASVVDKYVKSCLDAARLGSLRGITRYGNIVYRAALTGTDDIGNCLLRGDSGYFYEYDLKNYTELSSFVNEKFQTVTYFGVDAEELLEAVIGLRLLGVDRIVPIGSAMDIGVFWDGYDLIETLSRGVTVC